MKYNFVKLLQGGENIRKYQTAAGNGIQRIEKPAINLTSSELQTRLNNWSTTTDQQWLTNGQYDYAKMYKYYLEHPEEFKNIQSITATPNFTGAKTNDTGYLQWNQQFNQTGLNKFFGYDEGVANYYGPTTAARAGFLKYIQEQNQLQEQNQSPIKNNVEEGPKDNNEDVTNLQNIPLNPPDKLPWTDWIPITAQARNKWLSTIRQANLQKQMRFPLQEAPFLQHKITNNYHLRTDIQQNANELRDLAAFRSNSSDLIQNLDNMYKYDTQASQIENQAEQEKANKFAQETQIAENVANTNKQIGAEVANRNTQSNAAAWNNILNANQQLAAQKAAIANDWIDKIATSYDQNVLDNRLNQQAYQRGLIDHAANIAQQNAYDEYLNKSDYKNSQAYKSLLAEIAAAGQEAGGSGKEIPGLNWADYNDESKRETELERFWNSDSELASHYRTLFGKELEQAEKDLMNKYQLIGRRKAAYSLQLPYRLNNQGFYIPGSFTTPTFRRGGSVIARFIDYQNHTQRDQHNALKSSQRRSEQRQKTLDKQLDRLSKEQLLLLRSIFK